MVLNTTWKGGAPLTATKYTIESLTTFAFILESILSERCTIESRSRGFLLYSGQITTDYETKGAVQTGGH